MVRISWFDLICIILAIIIIMSADGKKNKLGIILSISITTIMLIAVNNIIYGTEEIYIGDYMPNPLLIHQDDGETAKLKRTIIDMKISVIIGIVITAIESIILYKKQILKKDFKSLIFVITIFFVPIIIAGVKLSSIYTYTS